jgi:hypothetical protein
MQIRIHTHFSWLRFAVVAVVLHFVVASSAIAQLGPGPYQTVPGSMVEEIGDHLTNGTPYMGSPTIRHRFVPMTATLTFDFSGLSPTVTAVIHDAVFEGGPPFEATVSGVGVGNPLRFTGSYIGPPEYYGFNWQFTPQADGSVLWNGSMGFAGGHLWQINVSDVMLVVPEPGVFSLVGVCLGVLFVFRMRKRAPGFRVLPADPAVRS